MIQIQISKRFYFKNSNLDIILRQAQDVDGEQSRTISDLEFRASDLNDVRNHA